MNSISSTQLHDLVEQQMIDFINAGQSFTSWEVRNALRDAYPNVDIGTAAVRDTVYAVLQNTIAPELQNLQVERRDYPQPDGSTDRAATFFKTPTATITVSVAPPVQQPPALTPGAQFYKALSALVNKPN